MTRLDQALRAVEDAQVARDDAADELRLLRLLTTLVRFGIGIGVVLPTVGIGLGIAVAWTAWSGLLGFVGGVCMVVGIVSAIVRAFRDDDLGDTRRRLLRAERELSDAQTSVAGAL